MVGMETLNSGDQDQLVWLFETRQSHDSGSQSQLNDPAISTAIGAQVGTNISRIVSVYHNTLPVS